MPYHMRKLPNKNLYRVYNKDTKKVHSKATTKENATKQIRLMNAIDHNPKFAKKIKKQNKKKKS